MAEMPNVVNGEVIEAAWGNQIRDRTAQRYADEADRAALNPTPGDGDLSFLEDSGDLELYFDTGWRGFLPPGMLVPFAGSIVPDGWLLCNGQLVSRTTFARLFAVVGTVYGVGDGSTTFALPDIRQRFILGVAAAGTGSTPGGVGGSIDHAHQITGAETDNQGGAAAHTHAGPSHTHPFSDTSGAPSSLLSNIPGGGGSQAGSATHTHSVSGTTGAGGTGATGAGGAILSHSHTLDTTNTDADNPPFIALRHIIKI